jgi:hypothetical protein
MAIEVDRGIKGEQVVAVMNRIAAMRGVPKTIRSCTPGRDKSTPHQCHPPFGVR